MFELSSGFSHLEDVLVEVELELFVCSVDTKLLEAVVFEVLEPCNVENPDTRTWFAPERIL